jgi:uncharacterized membrane protein YqgA involved in biofilm formation
MPFLGTIVNFFVVLITGFLGSLIKKNVPKRITDAVMSAMAICVVFIGIDGALEAAPHLSDSDFLSDGLIKMLIMILSLGLGTLVGELLELDNLVIKFGDFLQDKFAAGDTSGNFSRGFVTCSLIFCVGAMAVNGAILDAAGQPDILLAKSVIDGISCFVLAASLGIGCAFSAFFVLLYQGLISLLGLFIVSVLPAYSISYMSIVGSLVIILVGTNVLGVTKIKTANMVPAIFLPALFAPLFDLMF